MTDRAQHTPGKWSARVGETVTIRDAADNQLAIFTNMKTKQGGRRKPEEVAANARVGAAGPQLLEACRNWVKWLDSPGEGSFDGAFEYEERLMADMRAAIAAATGDPSHG